MRSGWTWIFPQEGKGETEKDELMRAVRCERIVRGDIVSIDLVRDCAISIFRIDYSQNLGADYSPEGKLCDIGSRKWSLGMKNDWYVRVRCRFVTDEKWLLREDPLK